MVEVAWIESHEAAIARCDLLLAVGSSMEVEPAASLPRLARAVGSSVIIVNRESTPHDDIGDVVVRGEIGAVLPALVGRPGEE